jgi:Holliday junction resolvase RusA-like endonuclease
MIGPLRAPTLTVEVDGLPVPQGSMVALPGGRHSNVVPSNRVVLGPWREKVSAAVSARMRMVGAVMLDCPVVVDLEFWLPRPKGEPRRPYPHVRPDIDKLVRAVLDSLSGTAIVDDSRVVRLTAEKRYAAQKCGARIEVRPR